MVRYRHAALEDAELASDLITAAYPPFPCDPVITRIEWEQPKQGFAYGRFIAERDARPIAFLAWRHAPWADVPERSCEVEVWLDRNALNRELLVELITWISDQAAKKDARVLVSICAEDESEMCDALKRVGYTLERVERVWELDLAANGLRIIEDAREAAKVTAEGGIHCTTLGEWKDVDRFKKLHDLFEATMQDVPHTVTIPPETYGDFVNRLQRPDRPHDRFWVALDGDRPAALSYLRYPPVRGTVWTGYTCTDRSYRGRGLARAIKLQSLAQAAELGVPLVYTDNDQENTSILHLNEQLGYRPRAGFVELHKRVTNTGHA